MTAHQGRGWRLAPTLVAMEAEADRLAPNRSRVSDGSIGDADHAARDSDHNPERGWVDALDLTHDPAGGFDAHGHARQVAARRDPRISYIISNRQIWNPLRGWRRYTGSSPHTKHAHFSIANSGRFDTSPWFRSQIPFPTPVVPPTFQENPVMYDVIRLHHDGTVWAYAGAWRYHVPTQDHLNVLIQAGVPQVDLRANPILSGVWLQMARDIATA